MGGGENEGGGLVEGENTSYRLVHKEKTLNPQLGPEKGWGKGGRCHTAGMRGKGARGGWGEEGSLSMARTQARSPDML